MPGRLRFLAIIVGLAVDIVGSLALGFVFGIVLVVFHLMQGIPIQDIATQMDAKHLNQSVIFLLASLGVGGIGSLVGGFVTGWMAKASRVTNGFAMGILSTLVSIPFWGTDPLWFNLLGVVMTMGMATTGAYFADLIFRRAPLPPRQHIITPI